GDFPVQNPAYRPTPAPFLEMNCSASFWLWADVPDGSGPGAPSPYSNGRDRASDEDLGVRLWTRSPVPPVPRGDGPSSRHCVGPSPWGPRLEQEDETESRPGHWGRMAGRVTEEEHFGSGVP